MAAVFEPKERVTCICLEGLALLKIVKHCQESLPTTASGSLLGLAVGGGVLEVTHAFPFPEPKSESQNNNNNNNKSTLDAVIGKDGDDDNNGDDFLEGHEFQLEMMRMLREVNVDNNCVGWYQSMYMGSYSTTTMLENQLSYQTDLSPNAVVVLYDPMQTAHGNLVLKCYRLTDACVALKTLQANNEESDPKKKQPHPQQQATSTTTTTTTSQKNAAPPLDPKQIFEEIPIKLRNPGLVRALLCDVSEGSYTEDRIDTTYFDRLDLSTNAYLEKYLERLCTWVDDLSTEQQKFQYYARQRGNKDDSNKDKDNKDNNNTHQPRRMESLLLSNQIRTYCDQVDHFAKGGFGKLFLAGGLHKEESINNNNNTSSSNTE